ncbi:terminase, partial [Acinetobacter baumannii]
FVDLLALDTALFTKNFSAGIVAQTEDDVGKIFRRKIREPFDRLPLALREKIGIVRSNESELVLGNGSSITVGMSMRGQALQFLHVSEF